MHPVQSIGYAAAYPAYPLNPPLLADNEYLRWTSADMVFQSRSVRGKNEYVQRCG